MVECKVRDKERRKKGWCMRLPNTLEGGTIGGRGEKEKQKKV